MLDHIPSLTMEPISDNYQQKRILDDSDEENLVGPPKLSNFGSALVNRKGNETPTNTTRKTVAFQDTDKVELLKTSHIPPISRHISSGNTNNTFGTLYHSLQAEDMSQSTLFSSLKNQPSMTTVDSNLPKYSYDNISNSSDNKEEHNLEKFRLIQQNMKEELSSRHIKRRNRRFITSRLSVLGPAKRNSAVSFDVSNSSINHEDSNGDINALNSSNASTFLQNQDYNIFLETQQTVNQAIPFDADLLKTDTVINYDKIEFGSLNPYQYLKRHNLPTSELPNISRVYFERQKEENRRVAVRKNTSASKQIVETKTNDPESIELFLKRENIRYDSYKRQPRRKIRESLVSTFGKSLSSPLVSSNPGSSSSICKPDKHSIENIELNPTRREALGLLDVNNGFKFDKKPHSTRSSTAGSKDHYNKIMNTSPAPIIKRVEIVEPEKVLVETIPLKSPSISLDSYQRKRRNIIQVNNTEYEKIELLGRGGSSKVYKVKTNGNKTYALKRVSFDEFDETSVDSFKGEIELLQKLENQTRVVKLIDHELDHGVLHVVMECGDHDLSQVLVQRVNMPLDIEFVRYHAQEMLKCVKVVHDAGIVHSDLKPANFVFVKGILKIIDFGIANVVPDHTVNIYRDTQIGTPNYMAPEALVVMNYASGQDQQQNKWKVGKPSDIWSCGCIIYQMIYGKPPYAGFQGQNRLLAIMNPDVKIVYPEKTHSGDIVPRTALDTIKACLVRNPEKRWNVEEVLNASFIRPVSVTNFFIRDLIRNAVKYGSDQGEVTNEKVEELAEDVWNRLAEFRL